MPLNIPDVIDLNGNFETVRDTLNSLNLSGIRQQLDDSIAKIHPDKPRNKGGSDEEIVKGQEVQVALTASRTSVLNGNIDVIKALLAAEAEVDAKNAQGYTPLHLVAQKMAVQRR
ncbi:hypothetical protein NPIL_615801 [Nephila pilipes]|uniref:Uncharacterized protein n=1 Tax=Nephila pilipes TaxID=299642 RepID=A0A8X6QJ93_NEPPI|nr:hypothetical protein NPIL_615801 [Nephila pilipes]